MGNKRPTLFRGGMNLLILAPFLLLRWHSDCAASIREYDQVSFITVLALRPATILLRFPVAPVITESRQASSLPSSSSSISISSPQIHFHCIFFSIRFPALTPRQRLASDVAPLDCVWASCMSIIYIPVFIAPLSVLDGLELRRPRLHAYRTL
jgi:hypothetical protein